MSTLSNKLVAACMVTAISMVMYGCGGGGSSSSDDMTGGGMECPAGQMRNDAGDCVAPPPPGPTEEEIAAATKAAGTKSDAIAAEAVQPVDAGLGGTDVDTYSMTISRDRDGTTVEIADTTLVDEDDPKFAQAMDLGGGTTMHTRMLANSDGDVEEEVVIVTTDIDPPLATLFAMVDGQAPTVRDLDDTMD